MAKKKKKQPYAEVKLFAAQYRKRYFHRLKQICDEIHPDLYETLSPRELETIYAYRGTHIRALGTHKVPGKITGYCEDFIREHLKQHQIEVIPDGLTLNAQEYSTYMIPLENIIQATKEKHIDREWYQYMNQDWYVEHLKKYLDYMEVLATMLMYLISHSAYSLWYVEWEFKLQRVSGHHGISQIFWLTGHRPQKYSIKFDDGKTRTGLQITYNVPKVFNERQIDKFIPLMVPPSAFGSKWEGVDTPVPVLIQEHALNRLDERLGCDVFGYVEQEMVESLANPVIHTTPDGKLLVEMRIRNKKAGYFLTEMDDNLIFIRTFLFLTNANTPEGHKLREEIGLKKEDVKYLKLDNLTTLMNSDIMDDKELCDTLRNAGCESLLILCEELKDRDFWSQKGEEKKIADKLKSYIRKDEWWDVIEDKDEEQEVNKEEPTPPDL